MKAILSSFGRRVNIGTQDATSDSAYKPSNAFSSPSAPRAQASFSSLDNAGRGIGDMPVNTSGSSHLSGHNAVSILAASNGTWKTKLNGSLRGTISRRKPLEPHTNHGVAAGQASSSDTAAARIRPSHPPSSFRDPSRTTRATDAVHGLRRKLSSASRTTISTASDGTPADLSASHSSSSPFRQPMSLTNPSSELSVEATGSQASNVHHTLNGLQHRNTQSNHASSGSPATDDLTTMSSSDLAARLNELAVANADGLLTDDEYRTLRHAVFDRMMQADTESTRSPTTASLSGLGLPLHVRDANGLGTQTIAKANANDFASTELLAVDAGRSRSSLGQTERPAPSVRSSRSGHAPGVQNVPDISRKSGRDPGRMLRESSRDSGSTGDVNLEARALPVRRDSTGKSSQLSSGDGYPRYASSSRTQRSSAAKSSRLSTFGRLRAASHTQRAQADAAARNLEEAVSAERTARSLRSVSLFESSGASALSCSPGRGGGRRETSPTSTRAEMAPSTMFGAEYVDKSSAEIQAEISVVQAEGNRMLSAFSAREEHLLSKHNQLEPHIVRAVLEQVQELCPLGCISRLDGSERASSMGRVPDDAGMDEAEAVVLRTELVHLYTQKAAVVKRYQDRLAFLQSKLRSAAIRQGLK